MTFSRYLHPIARAPKLSKRAAKTQFKKLLAAYSRGCVSNQRYRSLKKAKNFAAANDLEFPLWAQQEIARAAREWLRDAIGYTNAANPPPQ